MGYEGVHCIHLTQDGVQRQVLMNTAFKEGGEFHDQLSDF